MIIVNGISPSGNNQWFANTDNKWTRWISTDVQAEDVLTLPEEYLIYDSYDSLVAYLLSEPNEEIIIFDTTRQKFLSTEELVEELKTNNPEAFL